eukprot:4526967-Amphidinium_carterae.1
MANLELYRSHVVKLHTRYGQQSWVLIYQADVRCRKELMGRIRLRCIQHKEMGGTPAGYDDDRPWDYAWKAA